MRLKPALLVVALVLALTACGDDDDPETSDDITSESSGDTTSTSAGEQPAGDLEGDFLIAAEDHETVAEVTAALADLDDANPSLTVEIETFASYYENGPAFVRLCAGEVDGELLARQSYEVVNGTDTAACDVEYAEIAVGDVFLAYIDDAIVPVAEAVDAAT